MTEPNEGEQFFIEEDSIEDLLNKAAEPDADDPEDGKEPVEDGEEPDAGEAGDKDEPKSKYLGLFDDKDEALETMRFLSDRAAKADALEQEAVFKQQQEKAQQAQSQIDEFDRQATETWKRLIQDGKGDEAFQFMQNHILNKNAMITQAMIQDQLGQIAEFERGKQLFLQDKSVADVHENVGQIEALLRQGWTEKDAVGFIRSIKGGGGKQLDPEKVKAAKKKNRDQTYLEEPTSGKSKASGKVKEDQLTDGILEALGF